MKTENLKTIIRQLDSVVSKDAQTFAQANDLAKLIHAAPYMIRALEILSEEIILQGENGDQQNLSMIMHILLMAKGEV